jgi:hypothetical protein
METKDIIQTGLMVIMALLGFIFKDSIKNLKDDNDRISQDLNLLKAGIKLDNECWDKTNISAHKELWEVLHRVDKEQAETKTIVTRCKSCSGD